MCEWKEYRLGEIADVQTGPFGSQLHQSDYVDVGIPSIMPVNIGDRMNISTEKIVYITEEDAMRLSRYRVQKGDIVYSRRGDVEKCAYINEDEAGWLCGTGCLRIRIDSTHADSKFVAYYLSTEDMKSWISNNAVGTTMPNLNSSILQQVPLSLPSLDKQKQIASILSSLDDKIDLLNRENETLEAMAETLFRQWFIEDAKEDWEEVTLEDVALLNAGGDKPKIVSQNRTKELNVPVYSNGIDNEGLYGYTDKPRITEESVTISARGTIGYVALRTAPFVPIVRLITIRPKERVTSKFLYFWAKSQDINGTGTTQQQLTVPDFKLTKLVLPDKAAIDDFTKNVDQYYDKVISNKKQIQTLIYIRNGLLPRLMSNEISI